MGTVINPLDKIPDSELSEFCRKNHIQKLSLFGSYLKGNQTPDSDLDILVEFETEFIPTLLEISRMEIDLSKMLGGIKVDLRTREDLSRYFRESVVGSAHVQYAKS